MGPELRVAVFCRRMRKIGKPPESELRVVFEPPWCILFHCGPGCEEIDEGGADAGEDGGVEEAGGGAYG